MQQRIRYVGLDVDDTQYHGSALSQETGEVVDFRCRPTLKGLVRELDKLQKHLGVTLTLTIDPLPLVFPQYNHLARQGYRLFIGLGEQRPSPFESLTLTQRTKGQYCLTAWHPPAHP